MQTTNPSKRARTLPRRAHRESLAALLLLMAAMLAAGCDPARPSGQDPHAHDEAGGHVHAEDEPHDDTAESAHAEDGPHDHGAEAADPVDEPHDHGAEAPVPDDDGHAHGAEDDHGHDNAAAQTNDDGHSHAAAAAGHVDEVVLTLEAIRDHGITVREALEQVLKPTIVAPARVGFNTEAMAHVGSPLAGRIVQFHVRLGDVVAAGDPLLVVESPELGLAQAEFLERRQAIETAEPAIELARIAWERARSLYEESQGISLTEVQRREAEHAAAVAGRRTAEAAASASRQRLGLLGMSEAEITSLAASGHLAPRHTIVAPMAGQVVQRDITLGELVTPARDALVVVADLRTLWVIASVPEARLAAVSQGARAWVSGGVLGRHRHAGSVGFIAPVVDAATRTAQVRIEVADGSLGLRPGMFAQAEIEGTSPDGTEPEAVVAVPESALQTVEGGPAVFVPVEGEPNTFAVRPVTRGVSVGDLVPIYSGLAAGELFVATGSFILKAELGKAGAAHEH